MTEIVCTDRHPLFADPMRYFDNTRISTYKKCPRKFYLRHIRHWSRDSLAPALAFGLSWHDAMDTVWGGAHSDHSDRALVDAAMDAFNACWESRGMPSASAIRANPSAGAALAQRNPGVASEMLFQYVSQRRQFIRESEILEIEAPFAVPLTDSEWEGPIYIGRKDKVVKRRDGIWVIEHKTTSMYSKDKGLRPDYVESWSPNSQIDGYTYSENLIREGRVAGVLVDAALVHKTHHDVFKLIPIDRAPTHIEVWNKETEWWINLINQQAERFNTKQGSNEAMWTYPKNTESCGDFGGCTYRNLCKMVPSPHTKVDPPQGFLVEKWEPFKVLDVAKLGLPEEGA